MSGILSGPIDADGGRKRGADWPKQRAEKGLVVRHRTTGVVGRVVRFSPQQVVLRDGNGREHTLPVADGAFSVAGRTVNLIRPPIGPKVPSVTASGSLAPTDRGAKVAAASRIVVEGLHDAELVEKIWGDDLRAEGVVVEPLHGADDLAEIIAEFAPSPDRRLGVLLDHLVADSKEYRIAAAAARENVLITGHRYVDVWQAVKPSVIGIDAWPRIPKGTDWKEGICAAFGFGGTTGELWRVILGRVTSYRDLEPSLVGAVEELIDFVAPPPIE
ncbi:MAG: DUF3097 family protein [Acidimicrobiales bacterium]